MPIANAIRRFLPALCVMLMSTLPVSAQELPEGSGVEGGVLSLLDDITGSLLLDDKVATGGAVDVASSLLEDASGGGVQDDLIGTDTNPANPPIDPGAPVDGGLSLLLAAGAAYGARRLRRRKQD